jgi:ABC-2 type transport system permease protein
MKPMKTMHAIGAVALREVREILADRWTLVAVTIMPLIAGVLLTAMYANRIVADLPLGVIDEDRSVTSRIVFRALDAHQTLTAVAVDEPGAEAEPIMRSGAYAGLVVIPSGFEQKLKQGQQSTVLCYINNSNMVSGNALLKAASTTVGTISVGSAMQKANRSGALGQSSMALAQPVVVQVRPLFNPAQNYSDFFVPGILAALLQQVVVIGAALTWVREFRSGRITELLEMTGSLGAIAAGKLLVYVAIGAMWAVILFAGLFSFVGVPYTGSVLAGIVTVMLMIVAMGLVAMMISSFFEHRETAIQITFIVSSPAFLVSGYTFPAFAMTAPARWVGAIIPLTPFLTAWRRLVLYGAGWADIAGQIGILLVMIAVAGGVMMIRLRMRGAGNMRPVSPAPDPWRPSALPLDAPVSLPRDGDR